MPGVFRTIDRIKPTYDVIYRFVTFMCEVLLVVDILIITMAVAGRYIPFIPDPTWSEEMVLTCISYMAVLLVALAVRRGAHVRMTALDGHLPKGLVKSLNTLTNPAVLILSVITIMMGWKYATGTGSEGTYVGIPNMSRFWIYSPAPLTGVAMLIPELKALYSHIKGFFVKEEA